MSRLSKLSVLAASVIALAALSQPASAQVRYRTVPPASDGVPFYPYSDQSPYAQEFGERPSFQIFPNAYGYAPVVRAVPRCLYPNGWNVTDFSRDINGIPPGIDHQCPEPAGLRARY